jgi:hypothetical protein
MRNWSTFDKFPKYHSRNSVRTIDAKVDKDNSLSQQLGMKVYIKLVIIIELEW